MGQGAPAQARDFFSRALENLLPVDRERRWQALLGREEALSVLSETGPRKPTAIRRATACAAKNAARWLRVVMTS